MTLKLKTYEKFYLIFFLIILSALALSIVQQFRLSSQFPSYPVADEEHRHRRSTIFDNQGSLVSISEHTFVTPTQPLCTYWNCIDSYKCIDDGLGKLTVYVYDIARYIGENSKELLPPPSKEYVHLLWAIVHSKYIVSDPSKACIFVPSVDLLNRDNFSGENAAKVLSSLPFWNNGSNHLIFNMIPGSSPNYNSALEFAHGKAMVTGSGFTQRSYRRTFDIAIPLFNPHQRSEDFRNHDNQFRPMLLIASQQTFYRSVYNQLEDISDDRSDIVVLTKCSQSTDFHERCDLQGNKHSYPSILTDSKFCLITRERQLATINLHDILRAGCVPVICMDVYVMPFSEILDWARAAVFLNENRLDEIVDVLTSILADGNSYKNLQEQGRFYYERYLKSLAKIALTTLDILNDRVLPHRAPTYEHWNRQLIPGLPQNPFFVPLIPSQDYGFTAVVLTFDRFELMKQVVTNIAKSKSVAKIIIIWNNPELEPPVESRWPAISVPLKVGTSINSN